MTTQFFKYFNFFLSNYKAEIVMFDCLYDLKHFLLLMHLVEDFINQFSITIWNWVHSFWLWLCIFFKLIAIQSCLERSTSRPWSFQIVENTLVMLVSCCMIFEVPYAVNLNLDLCLKHRSILVMWLISDSVSNSLIIAVLLSDAGNSLCVVKQKSLAPLGFCNLILATSIAVTVAVFCWIQFLYLLIYISGLVLIKYLYSLLSL